MAIPWINLMYYLITTDSISNDQTTFNTTVNNFSPRMHFEADGSIAIKS